MEKRKIILTEFKQLKTLFAHQLDKYTSLDIVDSVFEKATVRLDEIIPELPFIEKEKNPYYRLMIFSAMAMSIYFSLTTILKNKSLSKKIIFAFIKANNPFYSTLPTNILFSWMVSRFENKFIN